MTKLSRLLSRGPIPASPSVVASSVAPASRRSLAKREVVACAVARQSHKSTGDDATDTPPLYRGVVAPVADPAEDGEINHKLRRPLGDPHGEPTSLPLTSVARHTHKTMPAAGQAVPR